MNRPRIFIFLFLVSFFLVSQSIAQVGMVKEDGGFWFVEKGRKIAFYQKEEATPNQAPARNNYLHPVFLPDGTKVTEDAPADHIHHRGIFWTWHQVIIDGKAIGDPWMLEDFKQDVQNVEFTRLPDGSGQFKTRVLWSSSQYKDGEKPYMEEQTTMILYQLDKRQQVILFDLKLKALVENLKLGGSDDIKGYGGFSVRMKLPDDIIFMNQNDEVEPKTEAVDAGRFMNISGSLSKKGKNGGVLIYADPNNQAEPQRWILRRKNSMQNAVFPGREPVAISTERPLELKYALVLYNGKLNEGKVVKKLSKLVE